MITADDVRRNALSKTEPKAAHDHECDWCLGTIKQGEMYVKFVFAANKKKVTRRYHIACWAEMGRTE